MASDPLLNRPFHGRYVIRRKLGSGGMADVYLAEDEELGRKVALKMLNERHARDEQFVERFRREAQSAAGLNHPNIVSVFDRGQAEATYYISMEYLDGPTLIKEVRTPAGHALVKLHPRKLAQATKPETAAAIRDMMVKVVQSGTGTHAQIPGVTVAGKTGTAAQLPGVTVAGKTGTAETGTSGRNNAWFICFAPAERPRVAIAVAVEGTSGTGGEVAAPIAKAVLQALLPPTSNA